MPCINLLIVILVPFFLKLSYPSAAMSTQQQCLTLLIRNYKNQKNRKLTMLIRSEAEIGVPYTHHEVHSKLIFQNFLSDC